MILPLPEWTMPMSSPSRTRERMVPRRWRAWVAVIVFIRSLYCHHEAKQAAEREARKRKFPVPCRAAGLWRLETNPQHRLRILDHPKARRLSALEPFLVHDRQ